MEKAALKDITLKKFYRRDKPAPAKGRFREFYQCDFDIAGPSDLMIADSEVISIIHDILIQIGKINGVQNFNFEIRLSHRKLISAMIEVSEIPQEQFRFVCSSIDKLDKVPWETVKKGLLNRGISEASSEVLHSLISVKGSPYQVVSDLRQNLKFLEKAAPVIDEMELLFKYLEAIIGLEKVNFDLSLARGLDYYTGVILEVNAISNSIQVGSISGGGRYDELIGMFARNKIPAVGASIGIERIFALLEEDLKNTLRSSYTDVIVSSISSDFTVERMKIAGDFMESWNWM